MSVSSLHFDKSVNQYSPVIGDVQRVVNYDEDGNEFISYESVDYPKLQKSLGSIKDWSLDVLLKAGINPDFPIHTGNNTRLEGLDSIEQFAAVADAILSENNNE